LKSSSNHFEESQKERILVIRFSSLGDVLLTAPALRALRAHFPDAHIDLLVAREYADAAALLPGPNRVLAFDRATGLRGLWKLRSDLARRYTILVDLQNSFRSAFLRATTWPTVWVKARRYRLRRWLLIRFKWNVYRATPPVPLRYVGALDVFGVTDDGRGLDLFLPDNVPIPESVATDDEGKGLIALCPGARHATKRWPPERWVAVGGLLRDAGYRISIVGSREERDVIAAVAAGIGDARTVAGGSIREVAALFRHSVAVVSNDTGLMHLAAGLGRPVVAIFGPTVREFGFYPFRARSVVFDHELSCRPCSAMGTESCPKRHFRCMLDTHPIAVFQALRDLLHSNPVSPT
jgi:ADP-heptose:LPS heptosyltransferase